MTDWWWYNGIMVEVLVLGGGRVETIGKGANSVSSNLVLMGMA